MTPLLGTIAFAGFLVLLMATCLTSILAAAIYLPFMGVGICLLLGCMLVAGYRELKAGSQQSSC
jgi:hypothetical protein